MVVVREQTQLLDHTLAVREGHGALPAGFFSRTEFTEMGHGTLPRPCLVAHALDEGVVREFLASDRSVMPAEKHGRLLAGKDGRS
jgi:hypothetical protein